jgi:UDP-sugar transporter A1/2/3
MELNEKNFLNSLKNLFPTRFSFIVFISYMGLFINQGILKYVIEYLFIIFANILLSVGILVTATKDKYNKFNYNPITVVLLTELVKLILSSTIYIKK